MCLAALAMIACLTSCTAPARSRHAHVDIYRESARTGVCTLHHVPLVSRTEFEYDFTQGTVDWDEAGFALVEKYPNVLDSMHSQKRSRQYPKSVRVRICPVCQGSFDSEIKVLRHRRI
jgi:hypothetical protein